jgi:hypothetical protein
LRQLAEKTGGACEFVTPKEDMAGVIVRMFHRMRVAQTNQLRIAWGREPIWQSPMPLSIFDGETLHLFATFAEIPTQMPTLSWEADGKTETAVPETIAATGNHDIARLGAARRIETAAKKEALGLALKYQLVSDQTSLFLVYLRDGEDKATELPEIHQVPQMMAQGSHGYGSVISGIAGSASFLRAERCFSESVSHSTARHTGLFSGPLALLKNMFRRTPTERDRPEVDTLTNITQSPQELLEHFDKQALAHQDYAQVLQLIQHFAGSDQVRNMIADFAKQEGITLEQAWAVFLDWLAARLTNEYTPSRHAKRLLRSQMKICDQARQTTLQSSLSSRFSSVSVGAWH